MNPVYIVRTSSFLPFAPVSNDEMENVLGQVNGKSSKARRIILRSNGIQFRHYAIDRETKKPNMTNAYLTSQAIRSLGILKGKVEILACGTTFPDQLAPNHAVMVHGELGWPRLEAVSCEGICVAGIAALKYAWLNVRANVAERAVAAGSELYSPHLLAHRFNEESQFKVAALEEQPYIAFEKDFLRWMLSDGAGAVLLESEPNSFLPNNLSLRIEWIELSSAANELPVCMYAGAEKNDDGSLRGWTTFTNEEWKTKSIFSLKQDVRLLNENIIRVTFVEPMKILKEKLGIRSLKVDWLLPHVSSYYFMPEIGKCLDEVGIKVPQERWFTNLKTRGNTGAASPYIMLDELVKSGQIKAGENILMFIPESGRFSSAFVYMTAING